MSTRTVEVTSDVWLSESKRGGQDDHLRLRDGVQEAYLWAKDPWPRNADQVAVASQVLRLTVRGDSAGARTVTARACSQAWVDDQVKWGNRPDATGTACTKDVGALTEGDVVDIDITPIGVAAAAEGGTNYGVKLTTSGTDTHRFYSSDSPYPPVVVTTWSTDVAAPTLNPAGGVISKDKPVVDLGYTNTDGDLTAVRLQVDAAADETTPDFDSSQVAATTARLDLADTAYAGIADDATTQYRGTITVGGVESDWSPWHTITRRSHGTLVVDSPALGVVTSPTPTIVATYTGHAPSGEVLTSWRVQVYDATRTVLLYDTDRQPADDPNTITAPIPARWKGRQVLTRQGGVGYSTRVLAWGHLDRVDAPADPAHIETWEDFTVNDAGTPAPTGLTVTTTAGDPTAVLAFTVTPDAPEQLVLSIDDTLHVIDDPLAFHTGGTGYSVPWPVSPQRDVPVKVAGVDADGDMSLWSNTATAHTSPLGVWFIDAERGLRFRLWGVDVEQWTFTDIGAYYNPDGTPYSVRVVNSQQGLRGDFVGELRDEPGLSLDDQVAAVKAMKARPNRAVQLITGRWSMAVELDNLGEGPANAHRSYQQRAIVRTGVRQVDFDPRG